MNLKNTAILGIRLRNSLTELSETNISDKGLICGYEKKTESCYLGEIGIETTNEDNKVKIDTLKPLTLKAYYTEKPYPNIAKLKHNKATYTQAHDAFRKSFIELPIEKNTAFWLVRRVGFDKLRPEQLYLSGTMDELDILINPMVDISKMIPILEVNGILRMASSERDFIFTLSKELDSLRSLLFLSEIDMDSLVKNISPQMRKTLLKKIKDLNKLLNP